MSGFTSRWWEVYTSVGRIHCSPLRVDGSRGNAGHLHFGAEGLLYGSLEQTVKGGAVSEPYHNYLC